MIRIWLRQLLKEADENNIAPPELTASAARMHHMDAVRAFCMLYGLMVHAATIAERPIFAMIELSSDYFRMATFFLVSGFFSVMVAMRLPAVDFFRHRARMLLLPLLAGLLLLNPITSWLTFWTYGHPIGFADWAAGGWQTAREILPRDLNWHLHLWFLFTLFGFALLTPVLIRLFRQPPVAGFVRLLERQPRLAPLLLAGAIAVVSVLLRTIHYRFFAMPAGSHPFQYILFASFIYLPFFAIGALAFIERSVLGLLHRLPVFGLLLFGVADLLLWPLAEGRLPWPIWQAGSLFFRAAFMLMIVMAILHLAQRYFSRGSRVLTMLTDSVYSFYLFHLLFIYAVAALLLKVTENPYLIFTAILVTGYPLLLALHVKWIAKSPFLLWLLNGKPWPYPARRMATATKGDS